MVFFNQEKHELRQNMKIKKKRKRNENEFIFLTDKKLFLFIQINFIWN
jgi:hypothetical protein